MGRQELYDASTRFYRVWTIGATTLPENRTLDIFFQNLCHACALPDFCHETGVHRPMSRCCCALSHGSIIWKEHTVQGPCGTSFRTGQEHYICIVVQNCKFQVRRQTQLFPLPNDKMTLWPYCRSLVPRFQIIFLYVLRTQSNPFCSPTVQFQNWLWWRVVIPKRPKTLSDTTGAGFSVLNSDLCISHCKGQSK